MGRVVSMFVAPSWDQLNHTGLIVARYLPGTATPCPGLVAWVSIASLCLGTFPR
jgi:hypothetical protein